MLKIEKKIIEFIEKKRNIIFLCILTIIALLIRLALLKFKSYDYNVFLSGWFDYFKTHGGLKALSNYPGDYNAPYMTIIALLSYLPIMDLYLIKIVSIVFDIVLAISSYLLVREIVGQNNKWLPYLTYIAILFLPQVIFNGAFWGQCDSIYATFCILALLFLIKEKYIKSFILLGVAFAFKLQFVFILPIFIILYFSKKKYSLLYFFIIPVVNFILCLPAIFFGKPILECFTIYLHQTQTYDYLLQANYLNIYRILGTQAQFIRPAGLLFAVAICALVLFYVIEKKIKWNNEKIMTLTLWFMIMLTFVLPCMHDRYLFVGEVLSIIYYICYRKNGIIVAIININAIITYSRFLLGYEIANPELITIAYLLIILFFTKKTFGLLIDKKKNETEM